MAKKESDLGSNEVEAPTSSKETVKETKTKETTKEAVVDDSHYDYETRGAKPVATPPSDETPPTTP